MAVDYVSCFIYFYIERVVFCDERFCEKICVEVRGMLMCVIDGVEDFVNKKLNNFDDEFKGSLLQDTNWNMVNKELGVCALQWTFGYKLFVPIFVLKLPLPRHNLKFSHPISHQTQNNK